MDTFKSAEKKQDIVFFCVYLDSSKYKLRKEGNRTSNHKADILERVSSFNR